MCDVRRLFMTMTKFIFSGHNERSETKSRVITDDKVEGICTKQKILEHFSLEIKFPCF
jgi:hypothetical protein